MIRVIKISCTEIPKKIISNQANKQQNYHTTRSRTHVCTHAVRPYMKSTHQKHIIIFRICLLQIRKIVGYHEKQRILSATYKTKDMLSCKK